jgi:hypothetical protein
MREVTTELIPALKMLSAIGWRFGCRRFGGEGGSFSDVQYRARAIVWK